MATGSYIQVSSGAGPKLATGPTYTENANTVQDEKVILGENYLASYILTTSFAVGAISTATANSHLLQIMAGASLKVRVRRIELFQAVAATTAAMMTVQILRLSTAGTGGTGGIGPAPLNPSDAAAGSSGMTLPTVKGTETTGIIAGTMYMVQTIAASNQITGPGLVFDFDRPRSQSLIIAAGTANGIAVKNVTAIAAATVIVNIWIDEFSF